MSKTAAEILMDLVAIPSVSSMSNRPVIEYALAYFDRDLWQVDLYSYRDGAGVEKVNLVAVTKSATEARDVELAFVCHTDTVPFDSAWTQATRPEMRGGNVYGRGSCDVKGFLACVLETVGRVKDLRKPLAVVLTADEEIGCVGARHLAQLRALRSKYMVIGEPTGLRPAYAGKGYGLGEIVVDGREAHSAFPSRGRSAIRDAARVLERLDAVAEQLTRDQNPAFDPPFTTINAGLIQGGTAKNIVPGKCSITIEWRPVPGPDPKRAAALIEEQLTALAVEYPEFQAQFEVKRLDLPFQPAATRTLEALAQSLTGRLSTTLAFGTEAGSLSGLSTETIVFGPGDMTVAHKTGEFVPVQELLECSECLNQFVTNLCLPAPE